MRKLLSILSVLLMLGMAFTSCGKSDNNGNDPFEKPEDKKDHSFNEAKVELSIMYSDEFLNLANVTCTLTDMNGKTQEYKIEPGKSELDLIVPTTTLPASCTMDVKIEKSENFDAYLASKDEINFFVTYYPMHIAAWFEKCGDGHLLEESLINTVEFRYNNPEDVKKEFDDLIKTLSFTFTGSFQNSGNNITFKGTVN